MSWHCSGPNQSTDAHRLVYGIFIGHACISMYVLYVVECVHNMYTLHTDI